MMFPNMMLVKPPIKYVNREEQINDLRLALDRMRVLGSIFQTIYEWYGGPGIGKSSLIQMLREECDKAQIPHTFIDFASDRNLRADMYSKDTSVLIEDLLSDFQVQGMGEVYEEIRQYRAAPEREKARKLVVLARAFQRFVRRVADENPVVLFFDETEQAEQDVVVVWLEEWIINPLIQSGRCLIVWAGRRPQRWKRFEVRRRVRSQELKVFEEKSTKELFSKNSAFPLSDLVVPARKLTRGHPYADTIVLQFLNHMVREGEKPKKERFDQIEVQLLDELAQNFVDLFAFKGLAPEVVSACRVMSLVRQFDVIMLREILTQALPGTFGEYGRNEFGGLLSRLRATQLVLWDERRKGYALDPTLRHIIGEHILRHSPDFYILVNRLAIEVYKDWIERAGDNRGVYIVEELYHQACINLSLRDPSPEEQVKLANLLKQRINEYHQNDSDLWAAALDRLYHELEDDPDLPGLIGNEGRGQLLDLVRAARVNVYQV